MPCSTTMLKLKMNPRKRIIREVEEDQIVAMLGQERSYMPEDYMSFYPGCKVDEFCREQICEWTFRVVDYFRIDREVVSVSLNYLDRLLSRIHLDRSGYKLAATTCLYIAVKVLHPQKLGELGALSDLSRGEFTMLDVANMERTVVLVELGWKLHPPTVSTMAHALLDHLTCITAAPKMDSSTLSDLYLNTSFFAELAVCDYDTSCRSSPRTSTIALACILNALEGMSSTRLDLSPVYKFQLSSRGLSAARNRLWELYERSEECALHKDVAVVAAAPPRSHSCSDIPHRRQDHQHRSSSFGTLPTAYHTDHNNNKSAGGNGSPVSVVGGSEASHQPVSSRQRQREVHSSRRNESW